MCSVDVATFPSLAFYVILIRIKHNSKVGSDGGFKILLSCIISRLLLGLGNCVQVIVKQCLVA